MLNTYIPYLPCYDGAVIIDSLKPLAWSLDTVPR